MKENKERLESMLDYIKYNIKFNNLSILERQFIFEKIKTAYSYKDSDDTYDTQSEGLLEPLQKLRKEKETYFKKLKKSIVAFALSAGILTLSVVGPASKIDGFISEKLKNDEETTEISENEVERRTTLILLLILSLIIDGIFCIATPIAFNYMSFYNCIYKYNKEEYERLKNEFLRNLYLYEDAIKSNKELLDTLSKIIKNNKSTLESDKELYDALLEFTNLQDKNRVYLNELVLEYKKDLK